MIEEIQQPEQQPDRPVVEQHGTRTPRSRARRAQETKPEVPKGFRSTRRTSKAFRSARKAVKAHEWRVYAAEVMANAKSGVLGVTTLIGLIAAGALAAVLVLVLIASAVNGVVRWNAQRTAKREATPAAQQARARENLLVIGVQDGKARGLLALRVDAKERQSFGFAIPDAALMEVPGQGFERVGDSYEAGPEAAMATVSNYLTVPFEQYLTVPYETYQEAVTQQRVDGLLPATIDTDLDAAARRRLSDEVERVKRDDVAIAPLPVKAVTVGDETYFEPQRDEVADLLQSWWGVKMVQTKRTVRVIVYNGSGEPGIAGSAARQLIKSGYRVVSTANADKFGYKLTRVVVQHGSPADGQRVADLLGVGKISQQPSDQEIADIIVIVGKDYKAPAEGR